MVGDERWAGAYGVAADFIAMTHCSAEFIPLEEIQVGGEGFRDCSVQ
jgi:hypothetical protein